jgi:serine/threonine protein kinase
MIGQIISNYEVKSLLGAGGMGTVYLAEHVKLGRQVAIKSLHAQFVNSEEIRARFIHEAKVMGQLQHPNIVTLYDYVETETGLFLIIELVDGKPIDDYIEQVSGPIEEGKAIEMMNEILEGFQYAHEKGLVHRDIKPSNLVIAAKNKVKILDFGIAKLVGDTSSKMTKTGTHIGTVYYMSPEQVKGDELDQRSDIYALGVTFFQMLTGNSPYKGMTKEFEVFMKIVNEELPDPRTIYPGVSEHMCAVIQKATAKDAKDRFQSCDEFAAALKDKSIALSPAIENSDSNLENAVHETKVNKDVNAVIDQPDSEVKPQIISAKAVQEHEKESPTSTDDAKSSPTEKNKRFKLYGLIGAAVVLIGLVFYFLIPSDQEAKPEAVNEKEELETTVVPITTAEQEAFDQLTKIRQRIEAGESFESMARKYSMDPRVKTNGGFYAAKYGEMVKELEDMVQKLDIGELSPIFETQFGYSLIIVLKKDTSTYSFRFILIEINDATSVTAVDTLQVLSKIDSTAVKSTVTSKMNSNEKEFKYSFRNDCYPLDDIGQNNDNAFYIDGIRYFKYSNIKLKPGRHQLKQILYFDDEIYEDQIIIYLDSKKFNIVFELICG